MIVAVVSHQGGAGTSLVAARLALSSARGGARTLAVDLDLAAPALHRFLAVDEATTRAYGRRGVVEILSEWEACIARRASAAEAPRAMPVPADLCAVDGGSGGSLSLLPAGRLDEGQALRSGAIRWRALYASDEGRLLVGLLRRALRALADVVVLDTPTGPHPASALAALALADRVVALTPPTDRALDGALRMLAGLGRWRPDGLAGRALLVPSRVSRDADPEAVVAWFDRARRGAADLPGIWLPASAPDDPPAKRAAAMVDTYVLPEVPRHSVGTPRVAAMADDPLALALDRLAHEIVTAPATSAAAGPGSAPSPAANPDELAELPAAAAAQRRAGLLDEAAQAISRCLAGAAAAGTATATVAWWHIEAARVHAAQARLVDAGDAFEAAMATAEAASPPDAVVQVAAAYGLACVAADRDEGDLAEAMLEEAIALSEPLASLSPPAFALPRERLAVVLDAAGDHDRAEALLRAAVAARRRQPHAPDALGRALHELASVHLSRGEKGTALELIEESAACKRRADPVDHLSLSRTLNALSLRLADAGEEAASLAAAKEAASVRKAARHRDAAPLQRALDRLDELVS